MTTADLILAKVREMPNITIEDKGEGRYRLSGTPWRNGSDSRCMALEVAADGEHGTWFDHRDNVGGSLYDFAERIGIQIPSGEPEATFDYYNEHGELVMQVVRSPGKKFWQRQPDGAGDWINSTTKPKVKRPPYRLADIIAHPDSVIFIVEGEKDAETAKRMGILATCNPGGANNWRTIYPDYLGYFNGRQVVIVPDNDESGIEHGYDVAMRLSGIADSIRILDPLGQGKGYDLSDWANDGGTSGRLYEMIKNAPEYKPSFKDRATRLKEAKTESTPVLTAEGIQEKPPLQVLSAHEILQTQWPEIAWIVPGLLPVGLGFLAGKSKTGKSWLALQLSLAVSSGGQFLSEKITQNKVLYLALEDTPRRLKDRMILQNWERSAELPCDFLTLGNFKDQIGDLRSGGAEVLAQAIEEKGYKLVIIDTFSRAVFTNQLEQHEMSRILDPLHTMAHQQDCLLLIVDHMAKHAGVTEDPVIDIYGSVAKGATLDTAIGLYRTRGKQEAKLVIDGRDIDGQKSLAISFDGMLGCWQYLGDSEAVKMTQRRSEILGVLFNEGPCTNKEIADLLDIPKGNVYRDMQPIMASGWVEKDDSKKYNLTNEGEKMAKKGLFDDNHDNRDN